VVRPGRSVAAEALLDRASEPASNFLHGEHAQRRVGRGHSSVLGRGGRRPLGGATVGEDRHQNVVLLVGRQDTQTAGQIIIRLDQNGRSQHVEVTPASSGG